MENVIEENQSTEKIGEENVDVEEERKSVDKNENSDEKLETNQENAEDEKNLVSEEEKIPTDEENETSDKEESEEKEQEEEEEEMQEDQNEDENENEVEDESEEKVKRREAFYPNHIVVISENEFLNQQSTKFIDFCVQKRIEYYMQVVAAEVSSDKAQAFDEFIAEIIHKLRIYIERVF